MSSAPRAISAVAAGAALGPVRARALVMLALSVCTRYPSPPRDDMAYRASGYGHQGPAGSRMTALAGTVTPIAAARSPWSRTD